LSGNFQPYNGSPESTAWASAVQDIVSAQEASLTRLNQSINSQSAQIAKLGQAASVGTSQQIQTTTRGLPYFQFNSVYLEHLALSTTSTTFFSITYNPPAWATSLTVTATWMLDVQRNNPNVVTMYQTIASGCAFTSNPYPASFAWAPFLSDNFFATPDPSTGWSPQTLSFVARVDSTANWTDYNHKVRFNAIGYFS